jgi:hypothetical protein
MGVSKGGVATLNAGRRPCASAGVGLRPAVFDLHVAICPARPPSTATRQPRPADLFHAGRARRLHPAPLAIDYAERMRAPATAHQGQGLQRRPSRLGIARAGVRHPRRRELVVLQNFIEDDGSHFVVAAGRAMPEPEYQAGRGVIASPAARAPGGGTSS